ncbi:unnamed protein product [Ectocarpus fasciculatus]
MVTSSSTHQHQGAEMPASTAPTQQSCNRQGSRGIVRLNVGGKKFLTSRSTIMQAGNCMLASMFRGKFNMETDEEGFAFIDRDGERFRHVLNFLRCSSLPSFDEAWRYEEIMEEADFYAIEELRELCERQLAALEEAKRKEKAKSFACRVTIVEGAADGGVAGQGTGGGVGTARERYGTGYFTLDEDF